MQQLVVFEEFKKKTVVDQIPFKDLSGQEQTVPLMVNEYWTSRQRQAHSLHEISYRACFKPQLPRFFIDRLTRPGDRVYDPFMGRGTTLLEAALADRVPCGCDVNPLSLRLLGPRLTPPTLTEISRRLQEIPWQSDEPSPEELLVFYHPETLRELGAMKNYFRQRREKGAFDDLDAWIEMVSLNRLTGHSVGFFSVYTLPPNQAVSVKSQIKINEKRKQTPPKRDVIKIILKKSRQLLKDLDETTRQRLTSVSKRAQLMTSLAESTPQLAPGSVHLVVTSPPFLDVVDYATDNWLRCWFSGIDPKTVALTVPKSPTVWQEVMTRVFKELHRVLAPGGHVAFEVGEVLLGSLKMEELVLPAGIAAGFKPMVVMVNAQVFTKTSHCWGVDNQSKGTNTNRIVVFKKEISA